MTCALQAGPPEAARASGFPASALPASALSASALPASALCTEVLADVARAEALAPEWHALNQRSATGCLFLGPQWLLAWWRAFGADRALRLVVVREGEALVGLLPCFTERVRAGGLTVERLAFLGDGVTGCDDLDLLALPGREEEVREAALHALAALPWDLCDLDGLPRESALLRTLAERFPAHKAVATAQGPVLREAALRYVCPSIPLLGTWEQYLGSLGRRENLRRREKWLQRQPGTSITLSTSGEAAARDLEIFFALHRARWAAEGGSDGIAGPRVEEFHRDATAALGAAGMLRLYTLRCARRPVASVYGVVHRDRFLYYQSGADPLWGSRSVGLVLLAHTVREAFAAGCGEFDFLRGDEKYKAEWQRAERWTVRLLLWRGARGQAARLLRAAGGGARTLVKSALPLSALQPLRKARRQVQARFSGKEQS